MKQKTPGHRCHPVLQKRAVSRAAEKEFFFAFKIIKEINSEGVAEPGKEDIKESGFEYLKSKYL